MIAELQGVDRNTYCIINDSTMYCKEETFACVGIKHFFTSHRCNQVCQEMGLNRKNLK